MVCLNLRAFALLKLTVVILLVFQIQVRINGGGNVSQVKATTDAAWGKILKIAQEDPKGWKERIKSMFMRFDADGSGDIDVEELGAGLSSLGVKLKSEELHAFASDIDDDGGGTISLDEFIAAVRE